MFAFTKGKVTSSRSVLLIDFDFESRFFGRNKNEIKTRNEYLQKDKEKEKNLVRFWRVLVLVCKSNGMK